MIRLALLTLFSALVSTSFSQNTIQESGDWCSADLGLFLKTEEQAKFVQWYKDGEILPGEIDEAINCMKYGEGVYSVTFAIHDETGKLTYDLTSIEGPVADFQANNYLAAAVTFFKAHSVSNEEIVSWHWDFGNGETSNEKAPRVMYKEEKVYTVTLTVTTESGCQHTITKNHKWSYSD